VSQRNPVFNVNADFYIEKLKDVVKDNPDSRLFLTLAEELRKRGEAEDAMKVLKAGIDKNPSFISARLTLGRWHLRDGRLAEAKREFIRVLELSPDDRFANRYIREADEQAVDVRGRKVVERLNKFRDGIRKAFPPDPPTHTATADN
jgi:tetratricopeptide (TPR) repeat protein